MPHTSAVISSSSTSHLIDFKRFLQIIPTTLVLLITLVLPASAQISTGVKIPGLTFGSVTQHGLTIVIPWLAQYISAAYKYLIGVSVIAAIIMIMWGGFLYMVGSTLGDAQTGKKYIANAVGGLVILFSAVLILRTINPATLNLNNLKIRFPNPESGLYDDNADASGAPIVSAGTPPANVNKNSYDKLFQNYASCSIYDWRVLKAVGLAESSLNVNSTGGKTKKYKGLFQFDVNGCYDNTAVYPDGLNLDCENLLDPETNTAAMAYRTQWAFKAIRATCPDDLSPEEYLLLLYTAHNTGPGVLKYVLQNGGCHKDQQLQWVRQFATVNPKYGALVPPDKAQKKWEFGEKVVQNFLSLGGGDVFDGKIDTNTCPIDTGQRTQI